jgi:hypothetical protein
LRSRRVSGSPRLLIDHSIAGFGISQIIVQSQTSYDAQAFACWAESQLSITAQVPK